ncbi:hypothetical protein OAF54_02925 [bacterium]|nr:hypothetical protein [bacterium]
MNFGVSETLGNAYAADAMRNLTMDIMAEIRDTDTEGICSQAELDQELGTALNAMLQTVAGRMTKLGIEIERIDS